MWLDILTDCPIALENNVVALLTHIIVLVFETTFCELEDLRNLLLIIEMLWMLLKNSYD